MVMILEGREIVKEFGGLTAITNLSFYVKENEILGLIGPNGAGKTTLFNTICGVFTPDRGEVLFRGEKITGQKSHKVAKRGIIRTFQSPLLFNEMTVFENVLIACHLGAKLRFWSALCNMNSYKKYEAERQDKALKVLRLIELDSLQSQLIKNLPHGYKRLVGIGVALAADPLLLLLDEPASGMNPNETLNLMNLVRKIRDNGITVFVIEHDMKMIMGISDRIIVLNYGQKIAEGLPHEIKKDKSVLQAYLGTNYLNGNVTGKNIKILKKE